MTVSLRNLVEGLLSDYDKGYAIPYKTDGRKIVKIGVKFNAETRTPENWIIEQLEP